MKGFSRADGRFSLCGLNCLLCPMRVGGHCPGCGGGEGNQPCAIARCGLAHGVSYCCDCGEYPCPRYGEEEYDSFISHKNRLRDMEKWQRAGASAYHAEQDERAALLARLLQGYNDGRRKTLFCQAANLLELEDLRGVMAALPHAHAGDVKDRAAAAARLIAQAAESRGVCLKLRKKK